jgi:hypothetical protein
MLWETWLDSITNRLGSTLDAANFELSGKTISRLKPMLAYVFEDYIETYSHWAWADMDMILGNLTKFLVRPLAEELRCHFYELLWTTIAHGKIVVVTCRVPDSRWPSRDSW